MANFYADPSHCLLSAIGPELDHIRAFRPQYLPTTCKDVQSLLFHTRQQVTTSLFSQQNEHDGNNGSV